MTNSERLSLTSNNEIIYDTIEHRGVKIDIYQDFSGKQFWILLDDEVIPLGTDMFSYKEVVHDLIDRKLDLILKFTKFRSGKLARLEWFQNGGHMDIRLVVDRRIMKVWLCDSTKDDLDRIIPEAKDILAIE